MMNSWLATQPAPKANRRNSNVSIASSVTVAANNKPRNAAAIAANWNVASKRRNNTYTRKANQWKSNVSSGRVRLTPYPSRKVQNATRNAAFRKQLAELPPPVERTYGEPFKPEWMIQKRVNNSGNRAKAIQARIAAMVKPAGNVRHTMWRGPQAKTRRRRN